VDKIVIVADTNIIVSSIFWSGNPYRIVQKGVNQEIIIFTSDELLNELRTVLKRDFSLDEQEIEDIIGTLMIFMHLTNPSERINAIKEDEKDNKVLECAASCKASYIISGDGHLLGLKEYTGIKILSAKQFLDILDKE